MEKAALRKGVKVGRDEPRQETPAHQSSYGAATNAASLVRMYASPMISNEIS